jgi:hypothetical protein
MVKKESVPTDCNSSCKVCRGLLDLQQHPENAKDVGAKTNLCSIIGTFSARFAEVCSARFAEICKIC